MSRLLFLLLLCLVSTNCSSPQITLTRVTHTRTYKMTDNQEFLFSDNERVYMDCNLTCHVCSVESEYKLHLYLHKNDDRQRRGTTVINATSTEHMSRNFSLKKNDTEIVCEAFLSNKNVTSKIRSRIRLKYNMPPTNEVKQPEGKPFELSLESPKISPTEVKDKRAAFAMFTCTARREGMALLSWHQIKGAEHVLLRTTSRLDSSSETFNSFFNKTLSESDTNTKLFCGARYFLEGHQLSDLMRSKTVTLKFDRTVGELDPERRHVLSYAVWLAVIGSIIIVALISMGLMTMVILNYRKRVKQFESDEALRNRQPMAPPPHEAVYEPVYGHGAGLKRPRVRPTGKQPTRK